MPMPMVPKVVEAFKSVVVLLFGYQPTCGLQNGHPLRDRYELEFGGQPVCLLKQQTICQILQLCRSLAFELYKLGYKSQWFIFYPK